MFCKKIGHPELAEKKHVLKELPTNINSAKPYTVLTWEQLEEINPVLTNKAKLLAESYGYSIS